MENRLDEAIASTWGEVARHDDVSLDPEQHVDVGVKAKVEHTATTVHHHDTVDRTRVTRSHCRRRLSAVRVQQSPARQQESARSNWAHSIGP